MNVLVNGYDLQGLGRKNVILGKNGSGKSRLLKMLEQGVRDQGTFGSVRYLSPERGGTLQYEASIEQNLINSPTWINDSRRLNQASQFRQQSAVQFSRLERLVLREIEKNAAVRADLKITFDATVDLINTLLDRVYIARTETAFRILDKKSGLLVQPTEVSSGEAELISLGIECLVFQRECALDKPNLLLIDEPDVHLHPDLQARFARFVESLVGERFVLLVATHSTALLGAMSQDEDTRLAFMRPGDMTLEFKPIGDAHRQVLPVFGAHPLSNVFNEAPVLLVEGEDDERIWQQAVRSSRGRISVYPVAVDGIPHLAQFEQEVARILEAVYDDAIGYSLRDRDLDPEHIEDVGPIKRMRLACRAAENLLLADECLARLGISWDDLRARVIAWLAGNQTHPHHGAMKALADGGFDRMNADLKDVRNDLVGIASNNKPWEVVVGQSIADLKVVDAPGTQSLQAFLGPKFVEVIGGPKRASKHAR